MRKLNLLLLLVAIFAAELANAQSGAMKVVCDNCRDPLSYPDDWANFAFNQIYGDDAWMDFDQADDFWIYNLNGDRVYVDVDFVMDGVNVFGNELPLWPTNLVQITLALPNGQILEVLRSVFMTSLPVPAPSGPGEGSDNGHSGNDGVDDSDSADTDELPEPPETEIIGTTGIEDPDANGDFPEPDWCEEC